MLTSDATPSDYVMEDKLATAVPLVAAGSPDPPFKSRLPALDGLRGIAILVVFLYHYAGSTHASSAWLRGLSMVFGLGWSGVDLFFVLSGFLITGILYDTLLDSGYYKNFYVRRMLRIFPVYYLFVLILLLLTPLLEIHWKPAHLFFLVYLGYPAALVWPGLVRVSSLVGITHLWSLCLEEQFYMGWPWLIAKWRSPGAILKACLTAAVLALALRAVIYTTHWLSIPWAYAFLPCRMDAIAIGAAIAILVRGAFRKRLQSWAPFAFVLMAAAVVAICETRGTTEHGDPVIATVGFSALAIMYGSLLVLSLKSGSWLQWLFSARIPRTFGKYSYGLYLYHFPLLLVLAPMREFFVARLHSYAIGAGVALSMSLVINMAVAVASFHFFEAPIMRLKSRFSYA